MRSELRNYDTNYNFYRKKVRRSQMEVFQRRTFRN